MNEELKKSLYNMIKGYYMQGIYTEEQLEDPFVKAGYITEAEKDEIIQAKKDADEAKQVELTDDATTDKK